MPEEEVCVRLVSNPIGFLIDHQPTSNFGPVAPPFVWVEWVTERRSHYETHLPVLQHFGWNFVGMNANTLTQGTGSKHSRVEWDLQKLHKHQCRCCWGGETETEGGGNFRLISRKSGFNRCAPIE